MAAAVGAGGIGAAIGAAVAANILDKPAAPDNIKEGPDASVNAQEEPKEPVAPNETPEEPASHLEETVEPAELDGTAKETNAPEEAPEEPASPKETPEDTAVPPEAREETTVPDGIPEEAPKESTDERTAGTDEPADTPEQPNSHKDTQQESNYETSPVVPIVAGAVAAGGLGAVIGASLADSAKPTSIKNPPNVDFSRESESIQGSTPNIDSNSIASHEPASSTNVQGQEAYFNADESPDPSLAPEALKRPSPTVEPPKEPNINAVPLVTAAPVAAGLGLASVDENVNSLPPNKTNGAFEEAGRQPNTKQVTEEIEKQDVLKDAMNKDDVNDQGNFNSSPIGHGKEVITQTPIKPPPLSIMPGLIMLLAGALTFALGTGALSLEPEDPAAGVYSGMGYMFNAVIAIAAGTHPALKSLKKASKVLNVVTGLGAIGTVAYMAATLTKDMQGAAEDLPQLSETDRLCYDICNAPSTPANQNNSTLQLLLKLCKSYLDEAAEKAREQSVVLVERAMIAGLSGITLLTIAQQLGKRDEGGNDMDDQDDDEEDDDNDEDSDEDNESEEEREEESEKEEESEAESDEEENEDESENEESEDDNRENQDEDENNDDRESDIADQDNIDEGDIEENFRDEYDNDDFTDELFEHFDRPNDSIAPV
jgi:hypothetical protein